MNSDRSSSPFLMLTLFGLLFGVGCGEQPEGPDRAAVTGTVFLDGTPLADGTLLFVPVEGTRGPRVSVRIDDGRFEADKVNGPAVGRHRIQIQSTAGPAFDDEQTLVRLTANPRRLSVLVVPPVYNTQSQLTADIQSGRVNRLNFDLTLPERR